MTVRDRLEKARLELAQAQAAWRAAEAALHVQRRKAHDAKHGVRQEKP
jgi:hypothetical protein